MLAIAFDATISLGNVLAAIVFLVGTVGGWLAFRTRIELVVKTLLERFEKHEAQDERMFQTLNTAIIQLVADTQRLIGRTEAEIHQRRRGDHS